MKQILIIGRQKSGEKNNAKLLAEAISKQTPVQITWAYYEDIVVEATNRGSKAWSALADNQWDLSDFTTIVFINWSHTRLYTDLAHSLAYIANKNGAKVWNSELLQTRSSTKISQLVELSYRSVLLPHTLFSLRAKQLEPYVASVGTPFIAKDPMASRGRSNYLCSDWKHFLKQAGLASSYILQEFIPNDRSDIRVFVVAAKPELVILRTGTSNTHLNNVSSGAYPELIPIGQLPARVRAHSRMIAKHFGRELTGIDFMRNTDTGEYVFLEINTTPQIINGAFADDKVIALARALER